MIDLKISEQFNHCVGNSWFELFEVETGEVLWSGSNKDCINHYETLDKNKYELLPN